MPVHVYMSIDVIKINVKACLKLILKDDLETLANSAVVYRVATNDVINAIFTYMYFIISSLCPFSHQYK